MITVQKMLLKLAQRVDPRTKKNQLFQDLTSSVNITNCADNGSGLIRVTTSTPHGLLSGDQCYIIAVTGTTEANNTLSNPNWTVERYDATKVDLLNSTYTHAYTSGGKLVGALIGTVDGNFSRQRLLDIYNDSRFILFNEYKKVLNPEQLTKRINGNIVLKTDLTFSSGSADKPSGYIRSIDLTDNAGLLIPIISANYVQAYSTSQTLTNRFVYEQGTKFINPSGSTYIADSNDYVLRYYGITEYSLTDVVGDSTGIAVTYESFIEDDHYILLEIAEAICNNQGMNDILSLTKKLLGG
jgi:hypothetical protein